MARMYMIHVWLAGLNRLTQVMLNDLILEVLSFQLEMDCQVMRQTLI